MKCRICDATTLVPVLDLGLQPWGNHFLKPHEVGTEPKYPLRLVYCTECALVQLDYTVPKETMFSDHTYLSGTTQTLSDHFRATAEVTWKTFLADRAAPAVLDIGSNDGTQLAHYKDLGCSVQGVEACAKIAAIANERGLPTLPDFFNEAIIPKLGKTFDAINASGVFFHLEELHSVSRAIKKLLKQDGVFVVQFLYMKSIVENLAFDQIYHEHLLYYTLETVEKLLNRHGLASFDAYWSPIHGGTIILHAGHSGERSVTERLEELRKKERESGVNTIESYQAFSKRVEKMRDETVLYLREKRGAGKRIFGFGAPVKGNTFLNYCAITTDLVECLVERNTLRRGLYAPGTHIPLLIEDELESQPDVYFVLAWNFRDEILRRNKQLIEDGVEFYFPVNPEGTNA